MSHYYLSVGNTVAATFDSKQAAMKRLEYFAVGIGVTIKKSEQQTSPAQERTTSKVLRGKIRYLKPGDFRLDA